MTVEYQKYTITERHVREQGWQSEYASKSVVTETRDSRIYIGTAVSRPQDKHVTE